MEISGKVSVLFKPDKQPATMDAAGADPPSRGLAANLIVNGRLMRQNLDAMGIKEAWLRAELEKQGYGT